MSIHVILGKPGSGKSLYATSLVIRELIESKRNIVTNLPLRPERLNEYIQETHPNVNTNFVDRVRILTDEEIAKFWMFRGPGEDKGEAGVAYYLDEAHIAFNARDWANIGRGALHYLSQHRKLGDVVFPITQAPGNLDKQFRSVSEDFTVLRNEYTAKFGPFKGRGRFVRKTYLSEPQANSEPFEVASFQIDAKGIASCYDTAKGIGVHGSKADIGRRAKGIPIWLVIPGALVLASLCVFIPLGLGKASQSYMNNGAGAKVVAASISAPAVAAAAAVVPLVRVQTFAEQNPGIFVRGIVLRGRTVNVILSDGRTLTEGDGMLRTVDRNSVLLVDGTRLFVKSLPREPRPIILAMPWSPPSLPPSAMPEPRGTTGGILPFPPNVIAKDSNATPKS